MARRISISVLLILLIGGALFAQAPKETPPQILVRAARAYVGAGFQWDGSYRVINYPGGDPGGGIGACTDLVVRSYRALGLDLQVLVHEDMKKNFSAYPAKKLYDQAAPDTNIDHRRAPNLMTFFQRKGTTLTTSFVPAELPNWQAGDIVIFDLLNNGIPSHIGIVSDRKAPSGAPLVIHHFPPSPTEEDCLANWKIVGHFRWFPKKPAAKPGR